MVISVPAFKKDRYYSFQLIDLYTFNFEYIGTRATGGDGEVIPAGNFLILGPSWKGPEPSGFTKVFHCETEFLLSITRTQLKGEDDLEQVIKIQEQYKVQTLSQYRGSHTPPAAPPVHWPEPLPLEKGKTLDVFAGAKIGLYGNSKEEALYPMYSTDAEGQPFHGANKYTLTLDKALPADAFASITMYNDKQLLVDNEIDRYLVNSTMLADFVRGDGDSVTIYIQKESPEGDLQRNWLPAPEGNFFMVMRLYLPTDEVLEGNWVPPTVGLSRL